MIKQAIQKIQKLVRSKNHQIPEIMMKLLSFLKYFARKIEQKGAEYAALDIYADALKLFRAYLVDQPFKLTRIATVEVSEAVDANSFEHLAQVVSLRNRFTKELAAFAPTDPFGKKVVGEMMEFKWAKKMQGVLFVAQQLKKQLETKKGIFLNMSEMSILFWYGCLKGDGLVHVTTLVQKLIDFVKEYFPLIDFVDQNSVSYLKQLSDPDRKIYLTASNGHQLFLKLRNPEVIDKLWQVGQENNVDEPFVSESSMIVRVKTEGSQKDEIIGVCGQKLIMPEGQEKDVRLPPAIMVGSSADCDLPLKSKYISRKQMVIIEDVRHQKIKESNGKKYNFYIVCLSTTNFTVVAFPMRLKASIGLIFFCNEVKYQIIGWDKVQHEFNQDLDEDKTLSLLPLEGGSAKNVQKINLLILSGEDKEKQISFEAKSNGLKKEGKHEDELRQIFQFQDEFYLKAGTKILCKTANDIIEGRTSKRIRVRKQMKIFLEEYTLIIE